MEDKNKKMPLWVLLAFSNIKQRRGALWLIGASAVFTLYCIPVAKYFHDLPWLEKVFLIEDWSWFAAMLAITAWYWLSLKWIDNNDFWAELGKR